jgi:hypothetical protein
MGHADQRKTGLTHYVHGNLPSSIQRIAT